MHARRLYHRLWPTEPVRFPSQDDDQGELTGTMTAPAQFVPATSNNPNSALDPPAKLQLNPSSIPHKPAITTVSKVDFSSIQEWLRLCEKMSDHSSCKAPPIRWQNLPGVQFRVIDIHRRCITSPPEDCSFVGLTYVWGAVKQLRLTELTKSLLMNDGGLELAWSSLTTTVRDAIVACERIGERYL